LKALQGKVPNSYVVDFYFDAEDDIHIIDIDPYTVHVPAILFDWHEHKDVLRKEMGNDEFEFKIVKSPVDRKLTGSVEDLQRFNVSQIINEKSGSIYGKNTVSIFVAAMTIAFIAFAITKTRKN